MNAVLTALGAAAACGLELLEALAIVLAVGSTRRWRDAIIGAAGGALACALIAAALGPLLLGSIPVHTLRFVIGVLLLLYGLEWLRKGTLRRAGLRKRSSSQADYDETAEELEDDPLPPEGEPDWAGRIVAFKGVLLECVEVVVIVSALASRPGGAVAAIAGAAVAALITLAAGVWLRAPITRIPETELKWGVGVMLTAFGTFFCAEGLNVDWPGGDAALLYVIAALALTSELQVRAWARS